MSPAARTELGAFVLLTVALGIVAALAPTPAWPTDRAIYDRLSDAWIIPGCAEIHCFRTLVPWTLSLVPLGSVLKWKIYAVLCQAAAAVAMGRLVVGGGASPRAGWQVTGLTVFGAGSLYTLFDPHTSDPLMHLMGPVLFILLSQSRIAESASVAAVGVFAKEFAAVPLWIATATRAMQGRRDDAWRLLRASAGVTMLWAAWRLALIAGMGYSNGPNPSADVLHGGYLAYWFASLEPVTVVSSMVMVFGGLWVCWPAGVAWGGVDLRRMTLAAMPAMLVWCVLQQPERALWNFAPVVMPAVAVILDRVSSGLGWSVVAAQALANLRLGAQLPWVPAARYTVPVAGVLAAMAVWSARPSRITERPSVG